MHERQQPLRACVLSCRLRRDFHLRKSEKKLSFLVILRGTMVVLCVSYLASPHAEISSMENRFTSRADFSGCNLITKMITGQSLNQVPERLDGAQCPRGRCRWLPGNILPWGLGADGKSGPVLKISFHRIVELKGTPSKN